MDGTLNIDFYYVFTSFFIFYYYCDVGLVEGVVVVQPKFFPLVVVG